MSIHDRLAEAALRDGDTPEQFRAGAQKHANAFWFWAIAGVAVGVFVGWVWSLPVFALALMTALQSVNATITAGKLERLMPYAETAAIAALLPDRIDLDDALQVGAIDDIRERFGNLMADESHEYAGCLYRPAALLPYPKATIRRGLEALLDFVEGRSDSTLLDPSSRTPEVADNLRSCLIFLDHYLDVPAAELPTDPRENISVGARLAVK